MLLMLLKERKDVGANQEKSKKAYRNVLEKQATKTVKQLEKAEQLEEFKFDKNILDTFFKKL